MFESLLQKKCTSNRLSKAMEMLAEWSEPYRDKMKVDDYTHTQGAIIKGEYMILSARWQRKTPKFNK